jgi:hypothetical protein
MDSLTAENSLFSEKVIAEGLELCYSIGEAQGRSNGFWVSVALADDSESVLIYGAIERAQEFFELIKRNTVTPCALRDVYEDVFGE